MTVHFIGAGPGAADLITIRGRDLLARCPVCLYAGSLVPPELLAHCPEGARLIEAYLDRRFAGWRAAAQNQRHPGRGRAGRRAGTMSEDEAYEVLGLHKGASDEEVARSHRSLMKKLHPDHGGSTDLAARVNEAKDVLMRRHQ